jgi:hypothetical protein
VGITNPVVGIAMYNKPSCLPLELILPINWVKAVLGHLFRLEAVPSLFVAETQN